MKCNGDCWNCEHEGCVEISTDEIKRQNEFDMEVKNGHLDTDSLKRLERQREYKREYSRKYYQTETGRKIINEGSKKSYYRHREERLKKAKEYYESHKEQIKARRNERPITAKEKKYRAQYNWRRNFEKRFNRKPNEQEINIWELRYDMNKKGEIVC